jgi:glutaryl-CoA dehydrogenase
MSVTVTLPAPPGPYLEKRLLPGDFYAYEELPSDQEPEKVERVRDFLRTQVASIVDDYWDRGGVSVLARQGVRESGAEYVGGPDSSEPRPSNRASPTVCAHLPGVTSHVFA